jgi:hypothetical protein
MLTRKQIDDYSEAMIVNWYSLQGTGGFGDAEAKAPIKHLSEADQRIIIWRMVAKFGEVAEVRRAL